MRKILLFPLTAVYYLVYFLWDLYRRIARPEKASSRVISVGNITVGGTGKTSLVEYIALKLSEANIKTALVAKGYKRPGSSALVVCDSKELNWELCGDEAAALAKSLDGIKVYVHSSKTRAALKASADGHEVIVIDDGFQHRRLFRNLDIVCIDGENPFGNGLLLPAGMLREPIRSLGRADAYVIFCENDQMPTPNLPEGKPVFRARKVAYKITTSAGDTIEITGRRALAFCGIANPESFYNTLKKSGSEIIAFERFKDHYIYKSEDIKRLIALMETGNAELALTTLKDYVKIEKMWPDDRMLCYIKINVAIDREDEFIKLIKNE